MSDAKQTIEPAKGMPQPTVEQINGLVKYVEGIYEAADRNVKPDPGRVTARRLNQILKKIFHAAAELLPPDAEHKKEKLRAASAHWSRHTGITAKLDSGIDERFVGCDVILEIDFMYASERSQERS